MKRARGFTLLEVLVALAIFAMVAASVLSASARSLQNASRLEDKTLAMWIADNRLNELQLEQTPPSSGRNQGELEFAGRRWEWRTQVDSTAEQDMRRVIVWVAAKPLGPERGSIEERAAARLVGFLGSQP
ncbi:TPA: GspI family T2SS minor pseudopilin variant XcpV [Pseudomonas aeruginosa]|uniref:GspI family T2SS minor pseudopilin variant XcpV n=1 Tax=Pseudomonas aeruginosa TaxID=287 RepID=UPI0003B9E693|nr:GspI family T2SS minor pseudopilin variant XcpV [Pseudomonas aeruginosa]ERU93873.1 general secretion pathway protein I [Pseudomonas aeruginosa M9A.1]OFV03466.1 type II secretion system protein GspI [Pseudomonas aeruginosa]TEF92776.1 type II secretion system protein GspI [Pseudomonas aeruginosa]TEG10892.1 type II secretion system protein GspI [Pseudomonas aeruginosa]TEG18580.1 type II secretion system protein GspI [Pseudomonas aeruginosa]